MAYLNNVWFENDILMHGKQGDLCIETGYEKELLFARHCPPDGDYWLFHSHWTLKQMEEYGSVPRKWHLVRVGSGVGALRTLRWVFEGRESHIDWFDFEQANWRGPVALPATPDDDPAGFAFRR
jgi:hypothetical protein